MTTKRDDLLVVLGKEDRKRLDRFKNKEMMSSDEDAIPLLLRRYEEMLKKIEESSPKWLWDTPKISEALWETSAIQPDEAPTIMMNPFHHLKSSIRIFKKGVRGPGGGRGGIGGTGGGPSL